MINTKLQKLLDALAGSGCRVKPRGQDFQAQCPGHDDNTESLSIAETSEGNIVMKCHAGCETSHVLKSLGLTFEVLFANNSNEANPRPRPRPRAKTTTPKPAPKPKTKKPQGKIVKTYPYTDEAGKLLYEAVRKEPKDFLQRQPLTNGKWQWNLKGVRRVIYNLPAVLKAINEDTLVFLVEGEKDAEALIKRGLVATTTPMGAGKWIDDYNTFFTNAELVIIPDNDKSGRDHAILVASKVVDIAKTIRIVDLPDLPEKGDVSDWLMEGGNQEDLLELAFKTDVVATTEEIHALFNNSGPAEEEKRTKAIDYYFEENHKTYSNSEDERVIADFAIDINSIVKDDEKGRIFYIKIRELDRGALRITDTIEVLPESLDDTRGFYKAIRPHTMGEIIQYRNENTKPISIFKWLLNHFDKPIVRRPNHVGLIIPTDLGEARPFWLFGNALICPPYKKETGRVVLPNDKNEYIVDKTVGFTLPLFKSESEKEQLVPIIDTNIEGAGEFLGEIKTKLLELIGGGDGSGRAPNFGKTILGYVAYHLYEKDLYRANDVNGHTVMLYVYGPKGTGKTTYFNTFLRAFFGLQNTKEIKGTNVSPSALENQMGMNSGLPVCYDEYNPEKTAMNYQSINGYYHKTGRSVSDMDRSGRNKFTPIRSTFSITSNFPINLDVDQADATESRVIYFEYKKEYRSRNYDLFEWFEKNLSQLSRVTTYLLLNQTDEKRKQLKSSVRKLYAKFKADLDAEVEKNPNTYVAEHRLTDNYVRILGCYELVFGIDEEYRAWIKSELLQRFAQAKANQKENALINQLIYLASSGRVKECWQYHYSNSNKELYVHISQLYEVYAEFRRDKSLSMNQFKEILKDYFIEFGGYEIATKKWYGTYFDRNNDPINVNKPIHSYVLKYSQVAGRNLLDQLFPYKQDHAGEIEYLRQELEKEPVIKPVINKGDLDDELPF